MARFAQQERKFYQSPLWLIFSIIVSVFLAFSTIRFFYSYQETRLRAREAEAKVVELEQEKETSQQSLTDISTEQGVEAELRDRYQLAKPGEGVVVITDPSDESATVPVQNDTFWQWLKSLFK